MDTATKGNIPVTGSKKVAKHSTAAIHPIADMERVIDQFFSRNMPSLWHRNSLSSLDDMFVLEGQRLPSLDVIDRDVDVLVRAEIPGIDKKYIDISITDNLLTIKGQTSHDKNEEKGDYHRHEISSASFARSFTLPVEVDSAKTVANLKDGILEIILPKAEASKRRSIAIK
jgi:HSP20 family protein